MPFDHDELSANANGGTEMMGRGLAKRLDPALFSKVHIIRSRVRTISKELPNVLWLHDLPQDPESARLRDPEFRKQFAKLVFVSDWQQREYNRHLGVPFREGIVMRNAIDPFEFDVDDLRARKPVPAHELRLIYHTTPHRGLELLVPMMEQLQKDFPDANIRLDVFSSFKAYGWEQRDVPYEEVFERCRQHPWIHYHGWQPNDVVREYLIRSHAFVYPSIWQETSCIAAIEALASLNDVITTDLAALPETLRHSQVSSSMLVRFSTDINELMNDYYRQLHAYVWRMLQIGPEQWKSARYTMNGQTVDFRPFAVEQWNAYNLGYGWEYRAKQWTDFLREITAK